MDDARPRLRIGTAGYQYDHWRDVFYPRDLPKRRWFEHYAAHFDTVEVNGTFYSLPRAETFEAWRGAAPEGFVYALKFSRYGSHTKRLRDAASTIATFLERTELLGPTRGPILVQLPPRWRADPERLDAFLAEAPRNERWVVELRDADWLRDDVFAVLERHGAALCVHDMLDDHPERATAEFVYRRYHGEHYAGSYSDDFLAAEARRIREHLDAGRDVYAYFNNDAEGWAVANARTLAEQAQPG